MKSLVVDPRAQAEFDKALMDSLARYPTRTVEFRQTIESALALIEANPEFAAAIGRRGYRLYVLGKRFPYSIVYHEDSNVIRVIAFAHHKRKFGYWNRRFNRP